MAKAINTIAKLTTGQGSGPWSTTDIAALDKALLELLRILVKRDAADQTAFCALQGYEKIIALLGSLSTTKNERKNNKKSSSKESKDDNKENPPPCVINTSNKSKQSSKRKGRKRQASVPADDDSEDLLSLDSCSTTAEAVPKCAVPSKSLGLCSEVLHSSLAQHANNCRHLLYSNLIAVLLDWLCCRLGDMTAPAGSSAGTLLPSDPAVSHTMQVGREGLMGDMQVGREGLMGDM